MLQIELDLSELREWVDQSEDPLARLAAANATRRAAEFVQRTWQLVAEGAVLPGMTRSFYDPQYAASIRTMISPYHVDVYTDYLGALAIQSGRPPVDLKPGLLHGPHSRVSQGGHRYTIVPLRHSTPGHSGQNMLPPLPDDVYRAALRGERIPALSEMGTRNIQPGWSVGPYAGLRREVAPGGRRGTYYTYRGVSEKSEPTKWVLPALPPMDVREAVWEYCRPRVEAIVEEEMLR